MSSVNMEARIHAHIDRLFAGAPIGERTSELKTEIYMNTVDRYHDLLKDGKEPEAAYAAAISGIGDVSELIASLGGNTATVSPPAPPKSKRPKMRHRVMLDHVNTIIWMATLMVYFIISFWTLAWHITWIIFLIARALQGVLYAIVDVVRGDRPGVPYSPSASQKKLHSQIDSALWLCIVALYFAVSFASGAWYISWIIFFLGIALDSLTSIILLYTTEKEAN